MPLDDDLALPLTDDELHRRRFLGMLGSGALSAAALGTAATLFRFFEPAVFYERDTRFAVGRPSEIAVGTVLVLPKQKVYVVRTPAGFYAVSATCTHLGCMTRYDRDAGPGGSISCPCHGSRFSVDGKVTGGPAPRPLPRLAISLEEGILIVDSGTPASGEGLLALTPGGAGKEV